MKVEILESDNAKVLQTMINEFIKSCVDEVVDIKYQSVWQFVSGAENAQVYSAMIIYK